MLLSFSKLNSLLNKRHEFRFELTDRDGLVARVSQFGRITFQYRYRCGGKSKRLKIGCFPDLTLTQARDRVPTLRQMLLEGKDPVIANKRALTVNKATLDDCINLLLERHVSKLRAKTQKLYQYSLNRHAVGSFDMPVEDIVVHEWCKYFDRIEDTVSGVASQDLLIRLKTCLRFCIKINLISNSSILMIAPRDVGKSSEIGERVVSPDEIKLTSC